MSVKHHRKIAVVERCPACGTENPEGFRFCSSCGTELVAAATPGEVRKTVTVVFCDVTGSTAMGEHEAARPASETMGLVSGYSSFDSAIAIVEIADLLEPDARRRAFEKALAGAEQKGNVVTAAKARAKLAAL